ncbi:MAG: beta-ketoacyl synthase chain length factor [Stellaceae bacterium]
MIRVAIEGVGLCGPGLANWAASQPILAGQQNHVPSPPRVPASDLLPANERRRAVQTVRLALAVGAEAFAGAECDPAAIPTVFASSGGDGETIHEILSVLVSSNPELSPTRFHNSVHNTPAGYWGIGTRSQAPSTSLCCHDDSFIAGLLEAAALVTTESLRVALIAYDVQYPAPLSMARPIGAPFATALVLAPASSAAGFAHVALTLRPARGAPTTMTAPTLEALRRDTPAARSLPLLAALASRSAEELTLGYLAEMELALAVTPVAALSVGHAAAVAK